MNKSHNSPVGIATVHEPDLQGFQSRQGLGIFFSKPTRWSLEHNQKPIQWVPDRDVKRAGHLFPIPKLKNELSNTSSPLYAFMVYRGDFTLFFYSEGYYQHSLAILSSQVLITWPVARVVI